MGFKALMLFLGLSCGVPLWAQTQPSTLKLVIPEYASKVCYTSTHDCDDFAAQLCARHGYERCRSAEVVKADFSVHAINVLRFARNEPYYSGSLEFLFCLFEPQNGKSLVCWESDISNFMPPDFAYCAVFPHRCQNGVSKPYLRPVLSAPGKNLLLEGEKPWWLDPFKNSGAMLATCDDYNKKENRGQVRFNESMPRCFQTISRNCSAKEVAACKVSSRGGGERCHVLECGDCGWRLIHWRNVRLDSCQKVSKNNCRSKYLRKPLSDPYNTKYCRETTEEVRAYVCLEGRVVWVPDLNPTVKAEPRLPEGLEFLQTNTCSKQNAGTSAETMDPPSALQSTPRSE